MVFEIEGFCINLDKISVITPVTIDETDVGNILPRSVRVSFTVYTVDKNPIYIFKDYRPEKLQLIDGSVLLDGRENQRSFQNGTLKLKDILQVDEMSKQRRILVGCLKEIYNKMKGYE